MWTANATGAGKKDWLEHSLHHLRHFNQIAILVAATVQWLLGALWYSPLLFAKPWMRLVKVSTGPGRRKAMIVGMICSFVGSWVLCFVLYHSILWSGAGTWGTGTLVGLIAWLGFIAAPSVAQSIYEGRPLKLFAIDTGYWLLAMILAGGILAGWK